MLRARSRLRLLEERLPAAALLCSYLRRARKLRRWGRPEMVDIFGGIYRNRSWLDGESASGSGSTLDRTAALRAELPRVLRALGVRSMLDIPCGDGGWISETDLPLDVYIGADIVEALVRLNEQRIGRGNAVRRFCCLDLTRDSLPRVDLILCRDGLVHFSDADVFRALRQIRGSGSRYLLATTFPDRPVNRPIVTGDWRPLNLQQPPFDFGPPHAILREHCSEQEGPFADKSLGLWRIADLPASGPSRRD